MSKKVTYFTGPGRCLGTGDVVAGSRAMSETPEDDQPAAEEVAQERNTIFERPGRCLGTGDVVAGSRATSETPSEDDEPTAEEVANETGTQLANDDEEAIATESAPVTDIPDKAAQTAAEKAKKEEKKIVGSVTRSGKSFKS